MMSEGSAAPIRIVGRYALYGELAAGGMATVHLGRLLGPVGFSRTVAIKRLHEQFAKDPEFVSMFLDEARLCARIRHPNVVPTLDVIAGDRQLLIVMEYVQGESLSRLFRAAVARGERVPLKVAIAILSGVLHGLHAAHEAKDERGQPLGIVHRDVSPQNVLVGADGIARVLDFGIAKAKGRLYTTQDGRVKGKLAYMAPEQLRSDPVDRKSDIFAASIMAWELFTGKRLFEGESEGATITKVLLDPIPVPSSAVADRSDDPAPSSRDRAPYWAALDAIVMRGLEREPSKRFDTAREMATALEEVVPPATVAQVSSWVESVAAEALLVRTARVQEIESSSADVRQHMDDVITKLTSDADVTKTQGRSSASGKLRIPAAVSSSELPSKAHMPVSSSNLVLPVSRDPWPKRAAALLALVAVAVMVLILQRGRGAPRQAESVALPTPSESGAVPSAAPKVSAEPVATAPPSAALIDGSTAEARPQTGAAAAVSASPPPAHSTASTPRPPHTPKPAPTVDCRDPYTRDSLGRKIYKIECL
jgi:serine/threonine protein kinase